jgi:formylmethanofuran dehydrogenase subunit E
MDDEPRKKKRKLSSSPDEEGASKKSNSALYRLVPLEIFFILLKQMKATYERELKDMREQRDAIRDAVEEWVDYGDLDVSHVHDQNLCELIKPEIKPCLECHPACDQCGESRYQRYVDVPPIGTICEDCATEIQMAINKSLGNQ